LKELLRLPFALLFAVSGVGHFARTDWYMRLMPPYLPHHRELVLLSGAAEIFLAVLLLIPRHSRAAAWGLIALLFAVFPANVHMAVTSGTPRAAMPDVSPLLAWLRLPLQAVLIAWALWYAAPASGEPR
jgi:uncharacterized membrane protein